MEQRETPSASQMLQAVLGLPSPDKLYTELRRFNDNLERLAPDIRKVADSVEGLTADDVRNLTNALQAANLPAVATMLSHFYNRIWGG